MKPNELIYFESVFRTGSIRHASRELGVSIATVSRAISSLEAALGYQLFQKDGAKFHVAKNAADLYQRLVKPIAELNLISREVSCNSSFKIVAPPFLSYITFSHISAEFEQKFKQQLLIEYSHSIKSRTRAYADLRLGYLDLFIDLKPADEYLLKSTQIHNDNLCQFHSKSTTESIERHGERSKYAKLTWISAEPQLFTECLSSQELEQAAICLDSYSDFLHAIELTDGLFGINLQSAVDTKRFSIGSVYADKEVKLYSIMNNELVLSSGEQREWLFKTINDIGEWIFKV
ncbi:LysR family transcriptional regulator [Shewanella sp. 30m-9]